MIRVFILNGPPGSGKDTIGAALLRRIKCTTTYFKFDLYKATADYYKVGLDEFIAAATDRVRKEEVFPPLGMSPRQALIYVSEKVYKPQFGKDYFGKLALSRMLDAKVDGDVVFTDGGFIEEAEVFEKAGIPTTVIRLHGRGTFEGDSRSHITLTGEQSGNFDLTLIEGEIKEATDAVIKIMES